MPELSSKRRSELRAEAHKLSPVVLIGDKGLTDNVVKEADRALAAHELIKVRAATDDREARAAWMTELCERLGAQPVQEIGKILVIYRENPEKAAPKPAPKPRPKPAIRKAEPEAKKKTVKRGSGSLWTKKPKTRSATGTSRPRSPAPSPRPASGPLRRRPRTSR